MCYYVMYAYFLTRLMHFLIYQFSTKNQFMRNSSGNNLELNSRGPELFEIDFTGESAL